MGYSSLTYRVIGGEQEHTYMCIWMVVFVFLEEMCGSCLHQVYSSSAECVEWCEGTKQPFLYCRRG